MLPSYQKLIETAKSKKKENRNFLDRLRKINPSNLDAVTNNLHDKAFIHIDCLQCANCCRITGPLLLNKDIERVSKYLKIKPSQFSDKYLRTDEDGDAVFKNMPCPFLKNENCCSVYNDRPGACRDYPHTQQRNIIQKLSITYHNSMICPAVAEVVEGLKKEFGK